MGMVVGGADQGGGTTLVRRLTIIALVIAEVNAGMSILARAIPDHELPKSLRDLVVEATPFTIMILRYGPVSFDAGGDQGSPAT
jgi:hypothetical protein